MLTKIATREEVVAEALSWIPTPYHKGGRVKHAGVDCGTILLCVYQAVGLVPETAEIDRFSNDWFCNTSEERYLFQVMRHAYKVAEAVAYPSLKAGPGNLVLTKSVKSRLYNHGGIVLCWPRVIHVTGSAGVEVADASTHWLWNHQAVVILDPWEKMKRENDDRR